MTGPASSLRRRGRWPVGFPARFALLVAALVGIAATGAVGMAAVETDRELRQQAIDGAVARAALAAGVLRTEREALATFASRVAADLCPVAARGDVATAARLVVRDATAAGPGDVVGIDGAVSAVSRQDGDPVAESALLTAAARRGLPLGVALDRFPWLVSSVPCPADSAGRGALTGSGGTIDTGRATTGPADFAGSASEARAIVFVARRLGADALERLRADVAIGPTAGLAIVDRGRVVLSGLSGAGVSDGGRSSAVVGSVRPGTAEVAHLDGTDVALAAIELGSGVRLVAAEPVARSSDPLAGMTVPAVVLAVTVVLLSVITVTAAVEREVRSPLRRLDRAVAALAEVDFDAPLPHDADDEVGRLALRFDSMRRRLRNVLRAAEARAEIGLAVTAGDAVEGGLSRVCAWLQRATGAGTAAIVLTADVDTDAAVHAIGFAVPPDPVALLSGDGAVAAAARSTRPDVLDACPLSGSVEYAVGMRRLRAAPLWAAGRSLGAAIVADPADDFAPESDDVLLAAAEQVALALARERLLSLARHQASTDGLTGLYNYRYLVDYLERQLAVAERAGSPLSVLMLDLDRFKVVNDTYGHQAGDEALRLVARTLARTIRRSDLAARYGGEEFVCVMANTDPAEARVVAEKIRAAVAASRLRVPGDAEGVRITVSVGGATFPTDAGDVPSLLNAADAALYRAKAEGRDRVRFIGDAGVAVVSRR